MTYSELHDEDFADDIPLSDAAFEREAERLSDLLGRLEAVRGVQSVDSDCAASDGEVVIRLRIKPCELVGDASDRAGDVADILTKMAFKLRS